MPQTVDIKDHYGAIRTRDGRIQIVALRPLTPGQAGELARIAAWAVAAAPARADDEGPARRIAVE